MSQFPPPPLPPFSSGTMSCIATDIIESLDKSHKPFYILYSVNMFGNQNKLKMSQINNNNKTVVNGKDTHLHRDCFGLSRNISKKLRDAPKQRLFNSARVQSPYPLRRVLHGKSSLLRQTFHFRFPHSLHIRSWRLGRLF